MKHLRLFKTTTAFEAEKDSIEKPYVVLTEDNEEIHYEKSGEPTPPSSPLTKVWYKDGTMREFDVTEIKGEPYGSMYLTNTKQFGDISTIDAIEIGTNVTSIADYAFCNEFNDLPPCYSPNTITSITIPNSVTSIGKYLCCNCSSLTSVTIGSGVTSIGPESFYYCSGLTSIEIPNSVTSIGNGAFESCI